MWMDEQKGPTNKRTDEQRRSLLEVPPASQGLLKIGAIRSLDHVQSVIFKKCGVCRVYQNFSSLVPAPERKWRNPVLILLP